MGNDLESYEINEKNVRLFLNLFHKILSQRFGLGEAFNETFDVELFNDINLGLDEFIDVMYLEYDIMLGDLK